jgi:drug/metabolite transporter (DMT)-like permease
LVVYPVVRGTGPSATVIVAGIVFGEVYSTIQWGGVLVLTMGIFGLAAYNFRTVTIDRATMMAALLFALLTGLWVAAYTNYDAYGIRQAADPMVFLVWFFVIDGLTMPLAYTVWMKRNATRLPPLVPLAIRGLAGGVMGLFSFGSIMLATWLDKVGEAAVLRETSTIFAAIIGYVFLKEVVGPVRFALMALIALGAVIVEFGRV